MFESVLDPKNDVVFKRIFGREDNKDILIHFLNDLLEFKAQKPIQEVTFLKPIQEPDIAAQKTSMVDILCKDEVGNQYIVEMQVAKERNFVKRAQYYAARAYSTQLGSSLAYGELKEIIFLAITNFVMFPDMAAYKSDHIILDRLTYSHELKDFTFTFLELPKFTKDSGELETVVEKWAYFFKHGGKLNSEMACMQAAGEEAVLQKAYQQLFRTNWSVEELRLYESAQKAEIGYWASLEQSKLEGVEQGRAEGRAEGLEEGRIGQKRIFAKKLLGQNLPLATIADMTDLSLEEIQKLRGEGD